MVGWANKQMVEDGETNPSPGTKKTSSICMPTERTLQSVNEL
jgi:hypothetical protein